MAYFQQKSAQENGYTRHFAPAREELPEEDWEEDAYDDGFDALDGEEEFEEEISEEERREETRHRYRVAAGFGDLGATIAGVVLILILVAFLINMLRFISSDFSQNFSLWQTKF